MPSYFSLGRSRELRAGVAGSLQGSNGTDAPLLFPSALDTPFESQDPSESLIGQL